MRFLSLITLLGIASCAGESNDGSDCAGTNTGRISITNEETSAIRIVINAVDYGVVTEDDSESFEVPAGEYSLRADWNSGGSACPAMNVNVTVCSAQSFTCDYQDGWSSP